MRGHARGRHWFEGGNEAQQEGSGGAAGFEGFGHLAGQNQCSGQGLDQKQLRVRCVRVGGVYTQLVGHQWLGLRCGRDGWG